MYGTLFSTADRESLLDRIATLSPQSRRRWGQMTIDRAVVHMADQLRMALGLIAPSPPHGPLRFPILRYLAIHVTPWPRGRTKGPPEAFTTSPSAFDSDIERLEELIRRFGELSPADSWPLHALFGQLSGRDWGVLCYRHLNHHLTQFDA